MEADTPDRLEDVGPQRVTYVADHLRLARCARHPAVAEPAETAEILPHPRIRRRRRQQFVLAQAHHAAARSPLRRSQPGHPDAIDIKPVAGLIERTPDQLV